MSTSDVVQTSPGWLPAEDLSEVRERMPIVYVEVVPVRLSDFGRVAKVGLLLRAMPDGTISRAVVSGRVLFNETIREALWRHVTKDLGPDCEPVLPMSMTPMTVAEYFPDPTRSGFHDPRQHAVSLVFVIPMNGLCEPAHDALDFTWLSVDEAVSEIVASEMTGGQDKLVKMAIASVGELP